MPNSTFFQIQMTPFEIYVLYVIWIAFFWCFAFPIWLDVWKQIRVKDLILLILVSICPILNFLVTSIVMTCQFADWLEEKKTDFKLSFAWLNKVIYELPEEERK